MFDYMIFKNRALKYFFFRSKPILESRFERVNRDDAEPFKPKTIFFNFLIQTFFSIENPEA